MGKSRKQKISQSKINRYAKSRVGYSGGYEISPYKVACKALEVDGRPQPSGCTYKSWVLKNADFILVEIGKLPRVASVQTKFYRRPTENSVKSFIKNHSKVNPSSDEFLSTFEWKAVRMMALKKYGPVCQCCGASAKSGAVIHVDHIKPRKIFPDLALDINNLQILCGDCNGGKGNWDMTDWRGTREDKLSSSCL